MSKSISLTSASKYDVNNLKFSEPSLEQIPNSKPVINYMRVNISTKYKDDTYGDLIFPTDEVFSFGTSVNTSQETKKVNGYSFPLCLYDKEPTDSQKEFVETINKVVEKCTDYLVENKKKIKKFQLQHSDLRNLNPLYWKRNDEGEIVDGKGPTLYAKLIVSKKQGDKILTIFKDYNDNVINPMDLIGKYCVARAAVKIESIFIGNKISIQIKLHQCYVRMIESGMKSLLPRPVPNNYVIISNEVKTETSQITKTDDKTDKTDDKIDDGSIPVSDEDEDKKVEEPEPVKRVVKRVVRKSS